MKNKMKKAQVCAGRVVGNGLIYGAGKDAEFYHVIYRGKKVFTSWSRDVAMAYAQSYYEIVQDQTNLTFGEIGADPDLYQYTFLNKG